MDIKFILYYEFLNIFFKCTIYILLTSHYLHFELLIIHIFKRVLVLKELGYREPSMYTKYEKNT